MTTTDAPTTDGPAADIPPWRPRGRPDRWAAGLLAATLGLLTVSYVFGLLAPRIDTWAPSNGVVPGTDLVYARLTVTNTSPAEAEILPDTQLVGAGRSLPGLRLVSVDILSDRAEDEPWTLDPTIVEDAPPVTLHDGETATVMLMWRVTDCDLIPTDPSPIPLVFRTPLGVSRTVDARRASTALSELGSGVGRGWAHRVTHGVCAANAPGGRPTAEP